MALPQAYTFVCRSVGLGVSDTASPNYNGGIAAVMFQAAASQNVQSASFIVVHMTDAAAADYTVGVTYTLTFSS